MLVQDHPEEEAIKPYPIEIIDWLLYQDIVAVLSLIKDQPDSNKYENYIRIGFEIYWDDVKNLEGLSIEKNREDKHDI